MGRFSYGDRVAVDLDDRVLAHLQAVISTKLRRRESCMFTWVDSDAVGDGRTSVWLHPAASLAFRYFGKRGPTINRAWIEELMRSANTVGGLHIVAEPHDSSNGNGGEE